MTALEAVGLARPATGAYADSMTAASEPRPPRRPHGIESEHIVTVVFLSTFTGPLAAFALLAGPSIAFSRIASPDALFGQVVAYCVIVGVAAVAAAATVETVRRIMRSRSGGTVDVLSALPMGLATERPHPRRPREPWSADHDTIRNLFFAAIFTMPVFLVVTLAAWRAIVAEPKMFPLPSLVVFVPLYGIPALGLSVARNATKRLAKGVNDVVAPRSLARA